jgi:hypothetical protein
MSALSSLVFPIVLGVSAPSGPPAEEINRQSIAITEPVQVQIRPTESKYLLPRMDDFPREYLNPVRGSELESTNAYQRSYTWNYEIMGEALNGYSLKRAYNDAVGLRSRYVEIGVARPMGDSNFTARIAGARASGQSGPRELGFGVVGSICLKIEF